ncbi:MAG: heme exporter protein CcmB [Pseudomonadales bacterium]|nr:heme exporter protein CcmB [Pseudomonadales bacterium]
MNAPAKARGPLLAILQRDLRVYSRGRSAWLNPLLFALLGITLFTLGLGPDRERVAADAAAVIWVVVLLGMMMSLDGLFKEDYVDGSLEQLLLMAGPVYFAVFGKVFAHWLVSAVPLVLASPLFALMLGVPLEHIPLLAFSLLVGSGILSFLGAVGAAVTVSLQSSGLLIALLILPLYVPVIIYGASLLQAAVDGWPYLAPLLMLCGLLCAVVVLAPLAIGIALKISLDT